MENTNSPDLENFANHNNIPISEISGGLLLNYNRGRRGSRTSPLPPILPQNDLQQPPLLQHLHSEISYTKKKIGLISVLFTIGGKKSAFTSKPKYVP